MNRKKTLTFSGGLSGLIAVFSLCLYNLSCLLIIFFTAKSEGQGDYYDVSRDVESGGSIIGVLLLLLPLLLVFYPWLKLFISMILNRTRPDYYGLFIGSGRVTKFVSVLLTMLNVGTIIWLTWDLSAESDRITSWNYDHAQCPDNSIIYIGVILRVIAFWGIVHLVHGIYHHTILKQRNHMKQFAMRILLIVSFMGMITSCQRRINFGIDWSDGAEREQTTNNGYKVSIERNENYSFEIVRVTDPEGKAVAVITRQNGDDISTVFKYLYDDSGEERGLIVYPYCYPVPKRDGDAKLKEDSIPEIKKYKEMLWADYGRNNHPCDIGLALAFSDNENLPYGSRYIFKRTGELLTEVCDSIRENAIIAGPGEKIDYELAQHELLLTSDSVIGDMLMWFIVRPIEAETDYKVKVYCGYRPMDELKFSDGKMVERMIYRSDRPEIYTKIVREDKGSQHVYKSTYDYDDKTMVSVYEGGILKRVEVVSKYGTALQQDVYFESADKKAYICFLKNYDYQKKRLVKVRETRIPLEDFYERCNEHEEMDLQPYMFDMWERFTFDFYGFASGLKDAEIYIE